jgi:hypothetical protein
MVASAFVALVVANTALVLASPAAPTPAASAPSGPLRTVVYKISVENANYAAIESYNAFDRLRALSVEDGTATIEIMARTPEALGIKVTELTRRRGYPAVFEGNVTANGGVYFPEESIDEATFVLLRFFGEDFASDHPLTLGDSWKTQAGDITVRKVDGRRVTLEVTETYKIPSSISELQVHGFVVYERGLLVPISGEVVRKRVEMHPEGVIELSHIIRFERTSDSFDKPAPL